ncbi:MAG: ATP-binding protein [Candidatus Woesearchaeota archaeon]
MDKEKLKEILLEQSKRKKEIVYVPRQLSEKIKEYLKTPFVIIISGVRRCGKSTLLFKIKQDLEHFYVDFDDERFINFKLDDFQSLYEVLIELFGEKEIFIFDEIQNIKGWERFVRRLHDEGKKVYLSGSNASMLSRELGTHLTGRNITFSLHPFSFREFLDFKKQPVDVGRLTSNEKSLLKRLFNEYLDKGGFPEYLLTEKEEYLKSVYENIIYRDIITRYKLPQEKPIKEVVYYSVSNLGKEISFNQLRKLTNLTSATTIKEYFEYLENSYLCFLVSRYDSSLKKQNYYNKKIYFIDTAIARLFGFRISKDLGRMLENVVFLELKRKNKEVYFYKGKTECDFIIREGITVTEAIQVTERLGENRDREIKGLLEAMAEFKLKEGLILTSDQEEEIKEGDKLIKVRPIWRWLLS